MVGESDNLTLLIPNSTTAHDSESASSTSHLYNLFPCDIFSQLTNSSQPTAIRFVFILLFNTLFDWIQGLLSSSPPTKILSVFVVYMTTSIAITPTFSPVYLTQDHKLTYEYTKNHCPSFSVLLALFGDKKIHAF